MAYTTVTPTTITRAGVTATPVTPTGTGPGNGIKFSNNGRRFIRVVNTGGSPTTVTETIVSTIDGQPVTGRTVTVGATTGEAYIGSFTSDYTAPDGTVTLDFSNVAGVSVYVLELS